MKLGKQCTQEFCKPQINKNNGISNPDKDCNFSLLYLFNINTGKNNKNKQQNFYEKLEKQIVCLDHYNRQTIYLIGSLISPRNTYLTPTQYRAMQAHNGR